MIERRFLYNGSAVPFSGEVTRIDPIPTVDHFIDDAASSALAVTGGLSSGRGTGFEYRVEAPRGFPLFRAAEYGSSTQGQKLREGRVQVFRTDVRTFVKTAEVIERITVDFVQAHLSSIHTIDDRFASIRPEDATTIHGLKLDGKEVLIELDLATFQKNPTKQAYRRVAKAASKKGEAPEEAKGVIFETIVKKMKWAGQAPEGASIRGNVITWKNVGRIHVGELLISDYYRRLTMLRIQLGSPIEGVFAMGDAQTNGMTVP